MKDLNTYIYFIEMQAETFIYDPCLTLGMAGRRGWAIRARLGASLALRSPCVSFQRQFPAPETCPQSAGTAGASPSSWMDQPKPWNVALPLPKH